MQELRLTWRHGDHMKSINDFQHSRDGKGQATLLAKFILVSEQFHLNALRFAQLASWAPSSYVSHTA